MVLSRILGFDIELPPERCISCFPTKDIRHDALLDGYYVWDLDTPPAVHGKIYLRGWRDRQGDLLGEETHCLADKGVGVCGCIAGRGEDLRHAI